MQAPETTLPWLWPLLIAPFVGSFIGVLIIRLPQGRAITWSRSACDTCNRALAPRDLVPLLSFALLRGRCRSCAADIPRLHLWVELAAIAVAALVVCADTDPAWIWADCALGWTLLALSWVDARHFLLPDVLTLPLVLAGLAATWVLDPPGLTDAALGAACGYLLLRAVEIAYRRLRGRDGLGQGDAKLMAAAGAWVGLQGLPLVLTGAACAGIVSAAVLARRANHENGPGALGDVPIPFGPAIAAALFVVRLMVR